MITLFMGRLATNQSRVSKAKPDTISVRTTIPSNIAKKLNLTDGDTIEWDTDKHGKTWMATIVKKM